jgi:hypothetical protein
MALHSATPREDKTWASVHSPTSALLSLFLFTNVGEDDSPTFLLRGSHMDVAAELGGAGYEGLEWSSIESLLPAVAFEREIVPATGAAGDVYLCHPSWCTGRRGLTVAGPHGSSPNRASGCRGRTPSSIRHQPSLWSRRSCAASAGPGEDRDGGTSDYLAVNRANWDSLWSQLRSSPPPLASTSTSSRASSTKQSRRWGPVGSTWCTPGPARCAGWQTFGGGLRW